MVDEKGAKPKFNPYPFAAELELNSLKKPAEVIHLTLKGVIVRLSAQLVFVGEYYTLGFVLPVSHHRIAVKVRVMKTFDQAVGANPTTIERRAELHFQGLSADMAKQIESFLAAVGQVK